MSAILYTGDNVQVMRERIADSSIQLTVTSPPYDNLRKYNGYAWDFEALARELYRVTKPGGVVVWVVADATVNGSETGTSFKQALFFKECGFNLHDTMIYEKAGTGACGSNYAYWSSFEFMFVISKGRPSTHNLICDKRNAYAGTATKGDRKRQDGRLHRNRKVRIIPEWSRRPNIWRIAAGFSRTGHPAPFPDALAQDHILSWSNPGDLVLDPFSGSGTTGKMAVTNNRDFIGIEISPEYVQLQLARIPGAVLSPSGEIAGRPCS
jgi:DNA modification methylase